MSKDTELMYESLKNRDGSLSPVKVKEFVEYFVQYRKEVSEVYNKVTEGTLKEGSYPAHTIISMYETLQEKKVDRDTTCADMIQMFGQDEGSKQLIQEYFGKLY